MSGHSKWSTIKRKKGVNDSKRGALFSKLIKEIYASAKSGGVTIDTNQRLKTAVFNAKNNNVPKDNIDRALEKIANNSQENLYEVLYEISGPLSGTFFIAECFTDNINRTVGEVRAAVARINGAMLKNGSLNYLFSKSGVIKVKKEDVFDIDTFILKVIDFGCENVDSFDEEIEIITAFENFYEVQKKIENLNIKIVYAKIEYIAKDKVSIRKDDELLIEKFIDKLEDLEDVQNLYHNIE